MNAKNNSPFGKLRSFFWPVYREEVKVFVPMLLMFFFITFNYNILRAAKDALVVTARSSGAEAIPFIKVWAILPAALLMTFLFTRLSNRYSSERVFYIMMSIFLGFFFFFAFVLYPMQDILHPNALCDRLEDILPVGCRGMIAIFRNWTFTAFYVMSELWGTAIMTVLFWGFANEITSVDAAKRFYVILAIGGNIAGALSGETVTLISYLGEKLQVHSTMDSWHISLIILSCVILLSGLATIQVFRRLNRDVLKNSTFKINQGPSNIKMGLRKNFAYLAKSKYLLCIAVIVITYNIAINLTEVVWKDQLHRLYPDPNDYNAYMGKVLVGIGVMATVIALFSGTIIRRFNWTFSAMIPPFIVLFTGVGFFSFLLFRNWGFEFVSSFLGSSSLAIGVFFGSMQNCLSRASKYTLFDTTKELSFIPLSQECKLKGKAAIDGVGSRLGKSGGAIVYQCLLMTLGTVAVTIPYVGIILLFVIGGWMVAVKSLGKRFNELMVKHETLDIAEGEEQTLEPALAQEGSVK